MTTPYVTCLIMLKNSFFYVFLHTLGDINYLILDPSLFQSCINFSNLTCQLIETYKYITDFYHQELQIHKIEVPLESCNSRIDTHYQISLVNNYFFYFQISLGRMAIDILKFLTLYLLVLFAFACGMNQLLWYYADLEYEKCYSLPGGQQNLQGEVKYGKHGKVVKLRPYCMHCIFLFTNYCIFHI